MRAGAEAEMEIRVACDIELVGPLKRFLVAIGGGEPKYETLALAHLPAAEHGVGGGGAHEGDHRV